MSSGSIIQEDFEDFGDLDIHSVVGATHVVFEG